MSPTSSFLYQLRCLTHSLRRFGGTYRDAPVIATVGAAQVDQGLAEPDPTALTGQKSLLAERAFELFFVDDTLLDQDLAHLAPRPLLLVGVRRSLCLVNCHLMGFGHLGYRV